MDWTGPTILYFDRKIYGARPFICRRHDTDTQLLHDPNQPACSYIADCNSFKTGILMGKVFSRFSVIAAITVYMTIVGLIYAVILKGIWQPEGLFKLTDDLLHTVSPILFAVFWLIFTFKENIHWKQVLPWLIFPFLYLIYSLIRGSITGDYPYDFINANKISYQQIAINSSLVLFSFLTISAIFIVISRLLKKD